jgi:hypothetical protein
MHEGDFGCEKTNLRDLRRTLHQLITERSRVELGQVLLKASSARKPLAETVDRVNVIGNTRAERLDVMLVPRVAHLLEQRPNLLLVTQSEGCSSRALRGLRDQKQ